MKRELAFALEAQSQLSCSLGRTRSSKPQPIQLSSEKLQISSENVNGLIDQFGGNGVRTNHCNGLHVYRRSKRFKTESVKVDEPNGELVTPTRGDEGKTLFAETESKAEVMIEAKIDVPMGTSRRFTRSALKPKVEDLGYGDLKSATGDSLGRTLVAETESKAEVMIEPKIDVPTGASGKFKRSAATKLKVVDLGVGRGDVSMLETPTKKLELKMSKKIELKKRPTTVKELFETGLLEGLPVFYNGGRKGIKLQGVIKGVGILCSCILCEESKVIPPAQFEIHACNSYRRATQYICLENGKSLLQVLKICKRSALDTLEETIQTVIGPFPGKESSICQNCKGSFLPSCSVNVGQICDSCMNSMKLQVGSTVATSEKSRTSKRVLGSKSSASVKSCFSPREKSRQKIKRKRSLGPASSPTSLRSASECNMSQENSQGKMTKKSLGPASAPTSLTSASKCNMSQEKSQGKMTKKSSRSVRIAKSHGSASANILSQRKRKEKLSERLLKSASVPRSSASATSQQKKSQWKITKKDQRMHWLVFEEGGLPDGSEVAYYSRGKKLLEGYKKGSGIFCFCCNCEVSPSQFEAHAGWASRKKPYGYIYTSNGVSLHEYAVSLLKHREYSSKDNDDLCVICADGGNLLLCDGCPRAFHKECASLPIIPRGKWYCKYCENRFQREKFVERNVNAVAAGRVSGVDPIEEITNRCIRIVKNSEETEVVACLLCKGYDYSKSGFGPRTVILCDQCEKEYHVGCLKKFQMADLEELPKGKWFCRTDCERIHSVLQNLLACGPEKLPDTLMDLIRGKQKDCGLDIVPDFDVRWRLLSGKIAPRETRFLLSEAVAIFHECFDPIIDSATGHDFIPSMVYGRSIRGQDFGGMYCAILTVNSAVVSAAILRIFGQDIAELPLVATSKCNQGKGYFQQLFSCIEKLLSFLSVKTIVLPAAVEAESIWTNKFGFGKILPEQLSNYRDNCSQMITFKGTSMLEKVVPQANHPDATTFDLSLQ